MASPTNSGSASTPASAAGWYAFIAALTIGPLTAAPFLLYSFFLDVGSASNVWARGMAIGAWIGCIVASAFWGYGQRRDELRRQRAGEYP